MNYLLRIDKVGLGDLCSITPFIRDFAEQRRDDRLYLKFEDTNFDLGIRRQHQLFDNNPYVRSYTGNEKIDVDYGLFRPPNIDSDYDDVIKDCVHVNIRKHNPPFKYIGALYYEFARRYGITIEQRTKYVDVHFSEKELQYKVNAEKPVCVVNLGFHPIYTQSRNWGYVRFQAVVDALKDKVDFIQLGSRVQGFYHYRLRNCMDMIDRADIRTSLMILNNAKFVLCHDSGFYHLSSFKGVRDKVIIPVLGGHDCYEYLNCYADNNTSYEFVYSNEMFQKCHAPGEYCCRTNSPYMTSLTPKCNDLCKYPSVDPFSGTLVCSCFAAIQPDEVISRFKKYF